MTIEDLTANELVPYLRRRLEGRRVVAVDNGDTLRLNDGTTLHLFMSDSDCCAVAGGNWVIEPDHLDAIITDVKVERKQEDQDEYGEHQATAIITILHNQNPVALATCYANAGNGGYYFSVLSLRVTNAVDPSGRHDLMFTVVQS